MNAAAPRFLVCDALRWKDLCAQDTVAGDRDAARSAAEALARRYGVRVHVLELVASVEGVVELGWDVHRA